MKIAFNPSTVAALTTPPNNKDITFDLRGRSIFARGVKFYGTDTNTWRDIKINNVSIGSNILDLRNGSNTTLTNTNGVVTINSTWRPVVDNLTSDSTTSSLSANQGRILAGLINGKSDSDHNHDDRYLKLSGGTMTGIIRATNRGGSWISGRDHCLIRSDDKTSSSYWSAILAIATVNGYWTLGHLGDGGERIGFNYDTDADYNAGHNNNHVIWLPTGGADGTLALTSDIPTSLKNPHALTISLNGTSQGSYDGSAAKNINITPGSIGAATSGHNHDGRYVRYYAVTTLDCNNLAVGLTVAKTTATNAAHTNHSAYLYISDVGTPFQIQIPDSSVPYIYKRYYSSGTWSGWFKLNAGYADSAGSVAWDNVTGKPSSYIPSAHTHSWTSITDKIVRGNEFNIVNAGFNEDLWFNYLPINDINKTATIKVYNFGNGAKGYTSIRASGFVKTGSSSNYVLLGDGGHKAISDFASSSHSHNYAANENYGGFTKSGRLPISGFYQSNESGSGGNAPWSSWMHLINCQHNNTGNNYALQIAASFYDNNIFKIRVTNNNVNNAWRDIIHSGNIGSQTVANAYHLRINSANTWSTWYWSGQSGQPSWLWGSNDGTNMYVWNPSNFRVAYAASAGNAATATKLQTPRNIWGQRFDGTADVNGTIYINNSDSSNGAIRLNNNVNPNARISAIDDKVIFNTGDAIRFGETSWDWNVWAGLKYTHSNKTIYLGIADESIFNANSAQSGGTLNLRAGISNIDLNSGTSIRGLATNGSPYVSYINLYDTSISLTTYGNISLTSSGPGTIKLTTGYGSSASISSDIKIESSRGVYLNSGNSGNVYLCQGGGKVGIGTTSPTQKLDVSGNIRATGQIVRESHGTSWVQGRNGALLRETSAAGYHALWSLKTTNGSWDFGEYSTSGWYNVPVLSYVTDSKYNSGSNTTTYQIKFPLDNGTIALTKNIPSSLPANGGNADTVDGYHVSGLLTALSNSNNGISITVGGTTKSVSNISVNYANSAGNAGTLGGMPRNYGQAPFNTIPYIGNDGVMEIGRYIDFHYDNSGSYDYSTRLQASGNNRNTVTLPSASGTLALTSYGGDDSTPIFLGYLNLDHGNDGTVSSSFYCLGYSVPFTYTRGGNYCRISIPDTTRLSFYINAAIASVNYSGGGMDTWVGVHRSTGAWWLHCYASGRNEVRVKGFRQSNENNDSWWGGNPLFSNNDGANRITVCIFGHVRYK